MAVRGVISTVVAFSDATISNDENDAGSRRKEPDAHDGRNERNEIIR